MFHINIRKQEYSFETLKEVDAAIDADKARPKDPRGIGTGASWQVADSLVEYACQRGVDVSRNEARSMLALAKAQVAGILATKGVNEPTNATLKRQYSRLVSKEAVRMCQKEIDRRKGA